MRFQIRLAVAWELLKLFPGETPGRLLKGAAKRSAGQAPTSQASPFSLANESKGVVVAATASSVVPNTLMLLSLSIVKVFIIVSPLATLCAAHDMDHSEVLERQGKSEQKSSLVNGWR